MFCSNRHLFLLVLLLVLISFLVVSLANSLNTLRPSCHDHERSALLHFKQSFVLDCHASWSPPFALPITLSWADSNPKDGDCCLWEGVKCSKETGHVIGLNLSSSCLYGTFPRNSTLFNLPYLEDLNLAHNNFNNSPIPSELGYRLNKLTSLNLSGSAFSGQVPLDISELSRLSLLDLSFNSGLQLKAFSLERLVQNLTHLNQLILDSVDISSPVPNFLANLASLRSVSLRHCNLYGDFPMSVFHLPHLEVLSVNRNLNLAGFLPTFEHTSPLRTLSLSYTSFSGELPPSIGTLAHVEILHLDVCKFSGQVPSSVGNRTKLFALGLAGNYFTGDMPSSFTNLTELQYLALSGLKATPVKLFPWLSKLNKLLYLELRTMNLTGNIPSILANFTRLRTLALDDNHLTGHIPQSLMNLTHLQYLSLSFNQLHINFDPLLKLRYLKYLYLDGLTLTFPANIRTNESFPKFTILYLNSCNLTEFPPFLHSQNELQGLQLRSNGFQGVIPQWFVNVTRDSLFGLDLAFNFLTGFEQPTKVLPWGKLEYLELNGNKIQGSLPIPSNSMVYYSMSNNSLTGEIPHELCYASALNYLDLSFNHLGGQIPECIGQLAGSLESLTLQRNNFHGTIPNAFPKSCKLKMINLSQNRLTGNMPRSLANCWMLEGVDIGSNHVNDTFPSWLGSLPNLEILVLRHNNFYGRIGRPNPTFGFHSLRIIDLSHNFHTGSLPSDYLQLWDAMKVTDEVQAAASRTLFANYNLLIPLLMESYTSIFYTITITNKGNDQFYREIFTMLRVIDFSSNTFTGKIPDIIGELKGLTAINLSNNNLEGGIPLSLANIRDLESLDLSNNKLSGEIPQQLTELTYLGVFNVSHNLLVGPIPHGNQFDSFDNSSFYGNLGLCGGTLSKRCGNADKPPTSASVTDNEEDDNSSVIDWVVRSLGCVCGLAIGCSIGKYMTGRNHEWFVETFGGKSRRTRTKPRRRS